MDIPGLNKQLAPGRRAIVLSVILFFAVGLPIWWKVTEVYRAPLPSTAIRQLGQERPALIFPLDLYLQVDSTPSDKCLATDTAQLAREINFNLDQSRPLPDSESNPSTIKFKFLVHPLLHGEPVPPGSPLVVVHPSQLARPRARFGPNHRIDLWVSDTGLAYSVEWFLSAFFGQINNYLDSARIPSAGRQVEQRTVRHTSAYQLSFSLFNGDASSGPTDWAIESALQATIRPFLTRLGPLFNFTVDSQIQYYSTLPIRPTPIQIDSQTTEYALYPRDLPHFVNTQDWNLDSTETNMPLLNFVLYVPPAHLSPLVVREADGTPSPYNAFLAPRWGGIVVNNPPHRPIAQLSGGDLLGPSRIFVSQLRGLLGVPDFADIVSPLQNEWIVESDPNSGPGISPWEFDLLQAKRNVENVAEAINTLNSLDRLVESIPNMVVQDSIQEKISLALDHIKMFDDSIQKGRFGEAYTHSRQALALAESAFFDPSMVSMLYFPNDHKFGVYMPLFVPILVPIIIAVLKEIKEWRQLRNQSKIKTQ